jgi:6-phosphogluconolactonase (cycloisomerase 2 family)
LKSRITRRNLLQASSLLLAPAALPQLLRAAAQTSTPRAPQGPTPAAQVPASGAAQGPTPGATQFNYAYVGTYTPNGGGIYLFRLDPVTAALTQLQIVDDIRNPTWLAINPARTRLYAVSEIDNYQGKHSGAVVSYAIDSGSLQLKRLGAVSSEGSMPAHVSVHPSGKFVFVANYGGGSVAVFPVGADGALGEATDVRPSVGPRHHVRAASDPPGQFAVSDHDGPHLHMVAPDPSGQFVIANDAGLDLTLVWRLDAAAGRLLPANVPVIPAPPGSAPRHFVFHPNGRVFYNLYEHDGKVAVYDYDAARGALKLKQVVSSLPPKFEGSNLASEIVMTADGRFLYVANRLHNAVAIFSVADDGQLHGTSETWVHADSPRSLCIDPGGAFLYSCNQRGDSITSFHLNAANGALTFTGRFEAVGSPAAMTILKRS